MYPLVNIESIDDKDRVKCFSIKTTSKSSLDKIEWNQLNAGSRTHSRMSQHYKLLPNHIFNTFKITGNNQY